MGRLLKSSPIEKYRDDILATLKHHRVVMVTGENRMWENPRSFLNSCTKSVEGRARMFITQPRRLAATNLANRLKTRMDNLVGLRLGGRHSRRDPADAHLAMYGRVSNDSNSV